MAVSTRPHRILHIITRLDPGGSAENTVLSATRVNPSQFESIVLTGPGLEGNGPPDEYRERLGEKLLVEPTLRRDIDLQGDVRTFFRLAGWIRRLRPDLVHLHSAKAGALGRAASRLVRPRIPVVYTPHGHVFSGYGGSLANRVFTAVEVLLAPFTTRIIGLTTDERRAFLEHHAGRNHQFRVVPSGVEMRDDDASDEQRRRYRETWDINDDTPVVGFVGRLVEVKGPDHFLDAAALIHAKRPDTKFVIAGDGDMRGMLEQKALQLGLAEATVWTGWRADARDMLPAMDVLLLTSRNEGQGRVLVEAMAAKRPCVGLRSGGVGDVIVDGKTGFVVPYPDLRSAAHKTLTLLENPTLRQTMGEAGCRRAHTLFSVDYMIRRLEEVYEEVL
ncbi:glycosyltransferase [bacterium]|nr:glycosyltransferase [bacterium]